MPNKKEDLLEGLRQIIEDINDLSEKFWKAEIDGYLKLEKLGVRLATLTDCIDDEWNT